MSFFSGLRGMMSGGKPLISEKWTAPESESDIDSIFSKGLHVIYKHSFTCGTCMMSKMKVENIIEKTGGNVQFHFVDVRSNRAISNYIAEKSGVRHESPQVFVVNEGGIVYHASHSTIQQGRILDALK